MDPNLGPTQTDEQELRNYLATSLPSLLLDSWFRQILLDDEGAIARLVREKLEGKGADDKEDAFGFTAEDVQLSVDDTRKASADAAEIAGVLASDYELPRLAAKMLNEQLDQAVSNVFGLGGDDLKNLLKELRLNLATRGEDLLLLIEDFSIFQGIQGGLIDSITLIASKDLLICPMRVVMAVTTGYFDHQLPDTVKTRTYIAFDLDLPSNGANQPDSAEFAAPYLNAVRVGPKALDAAFARGEEIPNQCPLCPVSARCHDAFGEVGGIGLFPFNRHALERLIRAKAKAEGTFIARDVLNRVLRPVLHQERDAVVNGYSPSASFAHEFAAGAHGILDLEDEAILTRTADTLETNTRRKTLVRFWGDGSGPQNLSETIHEAFNVPQVDGLSKGTGGPRPSTLKGTAPRVPPGASPTAPPTPVPPPSKSLPVLVAAVDRWNETGEIRQREQNDLRRIVHALVIESLELEDGFWRASAWTDPSRFTPAFPQLAIYLVKSPIPADDRQAVLVLQRGGSSDARALRALAWYNAVGSWREVPNGGRLQRLVYGKLKEWTNAVATQLMPSGMDQMSDELTAVTYALHMGARILGISGSYRDELADRVGALVNLGPPADQISDSWSPLQPLLMTAITGSVSMAADRDQLRQRLFRLASFSQDRNPLGLNIPLIARALQLVDQFQTASGNISSDVARHLAVLQSHLTDLDNLGTAMLGALPDLEVIGLDVRGAITELDNLLTRVSAADLLPPGVEQSSLRQAGRGIKDGDPGAVAKARQGLVRWGELSQGEKLHLITGDWFAPSNRIQAWMDAADAAVRALETKFAAGLGVRPEVDLVSTRTLDAVERASTALDRLLEGEEEVIA